MSIRGFTVNQLHKRLGKLIEQGEGRRYVAIDKESFSDNRESDGVCILDVHGMGVLACNVADDDGGTKFESDVVTCEYQFPDDQPEPTCTMPSPQAIADRWYSLEQIRTWLNEMERKRRLSLESGNRMPPDLTSDPAFAEWLCNEYRLAMAKGIELERRRAEQPEPTYTILQAIDRIVDGLRLDWVEDSSSSVVFGGVSSCATMFGKYRVNWGNSAVFFPNVMRGYREYADSIDHGKQLCLEDYRTRFRAELEKAVANHG